MLNFSFLRGDLDDSSLGGPHLDLIITQLVVVECEGGLLGDGAAVGIEADEAGPLHLLLQPQQSTPVPWDKLGVIMLVVLIGNVVTGNLVGLLVALAPQDELHVVAPLLCLILLNFDNSPCMSEYQVG